MADLHANRSHRRGLDSLHGGGWRVFAIILAVVLTLFGLALLAGGVWLIFLGGSWYYGLAGAGLLMTAWLLITSPGDALPVYGLVWMATVIWALWEVGTDWWAQVPRLVAPTVVLVLILPTAIALGSRGKR